jgi:hypothetical protein
MRVAKRIYLLEAKVGKREDSIFCQLLNPYLECLQCSRKEGRFLLS